MYFESTCDSCNIIIKDTRFKDEEFPYFLRISKDGYPRENYNAYHDMIAHQDEMMYHSAKKNKIPICLSESEGPHFGY
jgi:hypothetical protein